MSSTLKTDSGTFTTEPQKSVVQVGLKPQFWPQLHAAFTPAQAREFGYSLIKDADAADRMAAS